MGELTKIAEKTNFSLCIWKIFCHQITHNKSRYKGTKYFPNTQREVRFFCNFS